MHINNCAASVDELSSKIRRQRALVEDQVESEGVSTVLDVLVVEVVVAVGSVHQVRQANTPVVDGRAVTKFRLVIAGYVALPEIIAKCPRTARRRAGAAKPQV